MVSVRAQNVTDISNTVTGRQNCMIITMTPTNGIIYHPQKQRDHKSLSRFVLENLQRMHHLKEPMNLIRTPMNGSTSKLGRKLLANKYQIFILHPES